MPDILDHASELELFNINIALANRPGDLVRFTGQCHFCGEAVSIGHYCNKECADDHEREVWSKKNRKADEH